MRNGLFIYRIARDEGRGGNDLLAAVGACPRRAWEEGASADKPLQPKNPPRPSQIANVKNFVICITDASQVDRQIVVSVAEPTNLGRVAHLALDQVMAEGPKIQFPVFLDIHSADQFNNVAWMHPP